MKWWGWGEDGVSFSHDDKPGFKPFLGKHLGIDVDKTSARSLAFDELDIPEPQLSDDLRAALERAVGEEYVSDDALDRIVHARGKSLRDLVRQRRGDLGRVPDLVVRPGDETAVVEILSAALEADAVVIPFGGGTSISGSLEAPREETRTVISVDLGRMDKLLEIDETSRLARVCLGAHRTAVPAAIHDDAIDHEQHDRPEDGRQPRGDVEELVERMGVKQAAATKPPSSAPTIPMIAVTMIPPGSSPGMIAFAITPAIRPRTMNAMIPMPFLSSRLRRDCSLRRVG